MRRGRAGPDWLAPRIQARGQESEVVSPQAAPTWAARLGSKTARRGPCHPAESSVHQAEG